MIIVLKFLYLYHTNIFILIGIKYTSYFTDYRYYPTYTFFHKSVIIIKSLDY